MDVSIGVDVETVGIPDKSTTVRFIFRKRGQPPPGEIPPATLDVAAAKRSPRLGEP
ncbi:MAG: hypothetical protein QM788_13690 [Roseateles sp.]|uniref:hypothetical protein n=1 Tax=Roseateles sp. TaxID=1971397 RepID=UPI0039EA5C01